MAADGLSLSIAYIFQVRGLSSGTDCFSVAQGTVPHSIHGHCMHLLPLCCCTGRLGDLNIFYLQLSSSQEETASFLRAKAVRAVRCWIVGWSGAVPLSATFRGMMPSYNAAEFVRIW